MNYSPKLKTAISEIKDILKKNDIAGIIVLHTPGFSEYLMKIDTTYSCARLNGQGIQLRTKGLKVTKEKKQQLITDTSNMLNLLGTTTGNCAINIMDVSKVVDDMTKAEHTKGGHTSQASLNN